MDVWKRSAKLAGEVYQYFACCNHYGFKDQITRSCLSDSSNVAEGWERSSSKDRARFLEIAKGSLAEIISQAYKGQKIGYIDILQSKKWLAESQEVAAMLAALKQKILL
ncbi:MAG: four helix bundle protein [Candidatus Endobugula sp.]|jgi:four helix bundle protein